MPKKLEKCVKEIQKGKKGKGKNSAYAICTKALNNPKKPKK